MGHWQADWIWHSRRVRVNDYSYFRKEWRVNGPIQSAVLRVSAHHSVKVYVNGQRIGGYGSPAPTTPWKRKYYLSYEVSEWLRVGLNCLTADAHYLGGGGQNYIDALPGLRLELHLTYQDGTVQLIKSDTTWDVLGDMPHLAGTPYQQRRRISAIEAYDARKWDEGWRLPEWKGSLPMAKAKLSKIGELDWPMELQPIPEGKVEEEITPLSLSTEGMGDEALEYAQVFDAGKIVSGWSRFCLEGMPGAVVRLRYSEDIEERDGLLRVKHNVANEKSEHYYDEYTMRGDESETWQPDFSYKAFRYVEVTGYPSPITPGSGIVVCNAHTDLARTGSFHCSDTHLNSLYEAIIRTQTNNMLGQFVDCPHREQAQYLADTDLQAEALLYNFESVAMLEKTLRDFADMQLEDGTFPFNAPSNYDNPDFHIQIPEWDLHFATLLWKLYWFSGDVGLLRRHYRTLSRMVDYYLGIVDPVTGLVPLDKGWHISDWPYPTVEDKGEYLTVMQVKMVQALRVASEAAELIGHAEDSCKYDDCAIRLRTAMIRHLYDPIAKRFRDSKDSMQAHQGVNGIALYAGLVPEEDREQAIAYTATREWESKTVLSLPLLRMLFENGREAEAYALLSSKSYPGWGYMVVQGARTMWEGWDDIESHSHAWNGYPARLLQEYVVGIRAAAPGFTQTVIRPYMPEGLAFAEASVGTLHGELRVRWERSEAEIKIAAHIPEGVSARLEVSLPSGETTREWNAGEHKVIWPTGTEA